LFAVLCKQSEDFPEQWRSKLHPTPWPVHSRNRQSITPKVRWYRCVTFQVAVGAIYGRDLA
jgi:hypothetical protein